MNQTSLDKQISVWFIEHLWIPATFPKYHILSFPALYTSIFFSKGLGAIGDGAGLVGKADALDYSHKCSILGKARPASRDKSDPGIRWVWLTQLLCGLAACGVRDPLNHSTCSVLSQATTAQN